MKAYGVKRDENSALNPMTPFTGRDRGPADVAYRFLRVMPMPWSSMFTKTVSSAGSVVTALT